MSDDLISRSALKEIVTTIYNTYTEMSANQLGYDILRAIDNAPIVEDRTQEVLSLQETIRRLTLARPQGRWVLQAYEHFQNGNELYKYDCNICGHREEHAYSDSELSNFCPNCGAEMKGGAK